MKSAKITVSFGFILVTLGAAVAITTGKPSAESAEAAGWTDILPDPSFQGWTRVAIPADYPLSAKSQWSVDTADHAVACSGDQSHEWLRYDRQLGDFAFHVEWRLAKVEGAKYNSGVFVRTGADGRIWYQAQVGTTSAGYFFGDNPVDGSLRHFDLHSTAGNHVNDAGEWNTYDIHCEGEKITLLVNGSRSSEFDQCHNQKGYLGLEAEGSKIEFRNLRIRMLP